MKKILIIVAIALLSLAASGQPFKGTWTGKLSVQDIELTMVLHIGRSEERRVGKECRL